MQAAKLLSARTQQLLSQAPQSAHLSNFLACISQTPTAPTRLASVLSQGKLDRDPRIMEAMSAVHRGYIGYRLSRQYLSSLTNGYTYLLFHPKAEPADYTFLADNANLAAFAAREKTEIKKETAEPVAKMTWSQFITKNDSGSQRDVARSRKEKPASSDFAQFEDQYRTHWENEFEVRNISPSGPAEIEPSAVPLICVSGYEHAYFLDHGIDKAAFFDRFFAQLDWERIASLIESASAAAASGSLAAASTASPKARAQTLDSKLVGLGKGNMFTVEEIEHRLRNIVTHSPELLEYIAPQGRTGAESSVPHFIATRKIRVIAELIAAEQNQNLLLGKLGRLLDQIRAEYDTHHAAKDPNARTEAASRALVSLLYKSKRESDL